MDLPNEAASAQGTDRGFQKNNLPENLTGVRLPFQDLKCRSSSGPAAPPAKAAEGYTALLRFEEKPKYTPHRLHDGHNLRSVPPCNQMEEAEAPPIALLAFIMKAFMSSDVVYTSATPDMGAAALPDPSPGGPPKDPLIPFGAKCGVYFCGPLPYGG